MPAISHVRKSRHHFHPSRRLRWGCLGLVGAAVLAIVALYAALVIWPSVGAAGAEVLRKIIGTEAVTRLEGVAFQARDSLDRFEYKVGLKKPEAPWQMPTAEAVLPDSPTTAPMPTATPVPTVTATAVQVAEVSGVDIRQLIATLIPTSTPPTAASVAPPVSTPKPTPPPWAPPIVAPLGTLEGEGEWTPYILNTSGQIVAYRTFLQPDGERPYSVVGIVAFDMAYTRLHFVLGSSEPSVSGGPTGTGRIAAEDMQSGVLVAAFNGGFKAAHGHYGAMQTGIVALPPRDGLATVVIYDDWKVSIGEWGRDFTTQTPNMVAWRQNALPVIQDLEITKKVTTGTMGDWGGSIDGKIVTWRSGLGLSYDGGTLYYLAGPSLSMPALAGAMRDLGVYQGMILDANEYWVFFTAIRAQGTNLVAEPLLTDMKESKDRFLHRWSRDFFYITVTSEPPHQAPDEQAR